MSVVEIMEDLFFVQRGYLNGNHFVYRSEEPILIDTAYMGDFDETERHISSLGVDLGKVRLIVGTHCHCDHIGGHGLIQDESKCEIAMSRIGKHFIDTRDDWSTWWRYYVQEARFFDCNRALDDGDSISVGPHEFEVHLTPGHSADGIVLFNKRDGLLISSDTLWEYDMAVMTIRVEGSAAVFHMLESLSKVEKLGAKIVYPGHGRPFTDVEEAVSRARRRLKGFLDNRTAMGEDLIKKIVVYTLMMKQSVEEENFYQLLMTTPWYMETVDLYFDAQYEDVYGSIMKTLFDKGIVKRVDGRVVTTVTP
jgi:glyoxylase-like metal-dependent hydrolase (beta-lactamase superfamily II)